VRVPTVKFCLKYGDGRRVRDTSTWFFEMIPSTVLTQRLITGLISRTRRKNAVESDKPLRMLTFLLMIG
jgi:hypothetical protein